MDMASTTVTSLSACVMDAQRDNRSSRGVEPRTNRTKEIRVGLHGVRVRYKQLKILPLQEKQQLHQLLKRMSAAELIHFVQSTVQIAVEGQIVLRQRFPQTWQELDLDIQEWNKSLES